MKMSSDTYRAKRMQSVLPYIKNVTVQPVDIAVVIPAVNEYPGIKNTFDSLKNALYYFKQNKKEAESYIVRIIVNVNNRISADDTVRKNNKELLEYIKSLKEEFFIAIDSSSVGLEMPDKDGAGFARKIGLDYAYLCCKKEESDKLKLLCCMDSDTIVEEDYFSKIYEFFKKGYEAGITDFTHRLDGIESENKIIIEYERYLKHHASMLKEAGSPWYPVALGPTIVCTADEYASCGGMSRRTAGEDFYFLQALMKTTTEKTFGFISTVVHPSPRISDRVPFGTGAAVKKAIEDDVKIKDFPDDFFRILKEWFECIQRTSVSAVTDNDSHIEQILKQAETISPYLNLFLTKEHFDSVWNNLFFQNKKNSLFLVRAFHCWFDGLKTIRFFHTLEESMDLVNKPKS